MLNCLLRPEHIAVLAEMHAKTGVQTAHCDITSYLISFLLYLLFYSLLPRYSIPYFQKASRSTVQFFLSHFLVYRLYLIKIIIDSVVEGHKKLQ